MSARNGIRSQATPGRLLRVTAALATAGLWLLCTAAPAGADNCSGLSDCSASVQVGIAAAVALALGLLLFVGLPALLAAGAADGAAASAAADAAIGSYESANAAAVSAAAAADTAADAAASLAEAAAEGVVAPEAAAAAAEASAAANAAANAAAAAANAAQSAGQQALEASLGGDLAGAQAMSAAAADAAADAAGAAVDANTASIEAQIAGVNPTAALDNCGYVTQAVEDRFGGDLASYADPNGVINPGDIATNVGGQWAPATVSDIENALGAAGDGSRGVVALQWSGQSVGHAINVIEQGGTTFFVDGQSGQVATSLGQLYPGTTISGIQWIMTFP